MCTTYDHMCVVYDHNFSHKRILQLSRKTQKHYTLSTVKRTSTSRSRRTKGISNKYQNDQLDRRCDSLRTRSIRI